MFGEKKDLVSLKENARSFHSIVNTNTHTVHSERLYNTTIHDNKLHRSLVKIHAMQKKL